MPGKYRVLEKHVEISVEKPLILFHKETEI